jgi:nitroreductase
MEQVILEIVKDAAKAPSGHNTQPWQFEINKNQIIIKPNYDRKLKVVDTDNHALYISLGCALENLILSSKARNFNPKVSLNFDKDKDDITVDLIKTENIIKDELFDFIKERQCTRSPYATSPVEEAFINQLIKEAGNDRVDILFFTDKHKIKQLEPFIIEGSNLQFNNQEFKAELINWIRFNKKDAIRKGDGLWAKSLGFPNIPQFLGNLLMNRFVSAKSEVKRWKDLIEKSAGFALFVVEGNTKEDWVRLGQSFQRFGLQATQLKLKHAHVNMPCEEIEVRKKLMKHLNINNGRQALLLIRFGYAEAMPYSFRLPLEKLVLRNTPD